MAVLQRTRGFVASEEWRGRARRAGIRCATCHALRPEARGTLSEVVVAARPKRKRVVDGVHWLPGGVVLHEDLIHVIGVQTLKALCRFVPVFDECGTELKDYHFLIERVQRGSFRGSADTQLTLCRECGRLLGYPMGEWYLLRRYWDGSDGITVLADSVICTPDYFRTLLAPRRFPSLRAESKALVDEPRDGFPADCEELIEAIRKSGRFY
jgi:hypothetical protein